MKYQSVNESVLLKVSAFTFLTSFIRSPGHMKLPIERNIYRRVWLLTEKQPIPLKSNFLLFYFANDLEMQFTRNTPQWLIVWIWTELSRTSALFSTTHTVQWKSIHISGRGNAPRLNNFKLIRSWRNVGIGSSFSFVCAIFKLICIKVFTSFFIRNYFSLEKTFSPRKSSLNDFVSRWIF